MIFMGGIRIGGKILSNLKYADDIIFIGGEGSTAELQHLASRVDTIGRNYNLMIDIAKTKLMAQRDKNCTIRIQNIILAQVTTFHNLEYNISDDTTSKAELRSRLNTG